MAAYSHWDNSKNSGILLRQHLQAVAASSIESIVPCIDFGKVGFELVKQLAYWQGLFHDLGKYTDYFQKYLLKGDDTRLKNHAQISGCFYYAFTRDTLTSLSGESLSEQDIRIISYLSYVILRQHHRSLNFDELSAETENIKKWKLLDQQAMNLMEYSAGILNDIKKETEINLSLEDFSRYLNLNSLKADSFFNYIPVLLQSKRIHDNKWYFFIIYLFSLLIDNDKRHAAGLSQGGGYFATPALVENYLQSKNTHSGTAQGADLEGKQLKLVDKREQARRTVLQQIELMSREELISRRFFSLTAPTGIGKTLTSLQAALRLQERIQEEEGYLPRIVTAIPFINIIQQTEQEYLKVIGENSRVISHYRLADLSVTSHAEELSLDQQLMEVESWDGEIVLTTFVQLFQSLFTGQNNKLKKINKLAGSIVILDEAQALPEKYLPLVGAVMMGLASHLGTRFILMTATQPKLLEFGQLLWKEDFGKKELLPGGEKYFNDLKRTCLIPELDRRMDTDDLIDFFFEKWSGSGSALVVVNTIKRSIEVFRKLKEKLEEKDSSAEIFYLSTNIIPAKRREVIRRVKEAIAENKKVVLISTQTIEAGVDLDFDMAIRDFAPLDSLIQTAGRVNREGNKGENLPVYLVRLENDNHWIYNLHHRQTTLEMLGDKPILENEYSQLMEKYYQKALERGLPEESKHLWQEGVVPLDFTELQKFQLIEKTGEIVDVLIDDGSEEIEVLLELYEKIKSGEDVEKKDVCKVFPKYKSLSAGVLGTFELKAVLRTLFARLSEYMVQVRLKRLEGNVPIEYYSRNGMGASFYWVPPEQLEDYYDEETGYKDESGNAYLF